MTEDHEAEPVGSAAEGAVGESEHLAAKISDETAGRVESIVREALAPYDERLLAMERRLEEAAAAPPAAVEEAVVPPVEKVLPVEVEPEPPLVRPRKKHWAHMLPRGLF